MRSLRVEAGEKTVQDPQNSGIWRKTEFSNASEIAERREAIEREIQRLQDAKINPDLEAKILEGKK